MHVIHSKIFQDLSYYMCCCILEHDVGTLERKSSKCDKKINKMNAAGLSKLTQM